ncbi:MAG: hypothetical protein QOJ02_2124 [Acidobacteriota bacterium]|jgi:DNA-binding NtrC family response regulator|nr:hypothetical protein [Acidobacteriota bacterium]
MNHSYAHPVARITNVANGLWYSPGGLVVAVVEPVVDTNLKSKQRLNEVMEKIQVLIIEDDRSVGDALKIVMDDSGYKAVVAINAQQGIEQARLRRFGLIITDVQLPDMSGLDVLTILRKKVPTIPIIIITAHSTQEVVTQALARGAFQVLPKPFLPSEILDLAQRAVAK